MPFVRIDLDLKVVPSRKKALAKEVTEAVVRKYWRSSPAVHVINDMPEEPTSHKEMRTANS